VTRLSGALPRATRLFGAPLIFSKTFNSNSFKYNELEDIMNKIIVWD